MPPLHPSASSYYTLLMHAALDKRQKPPAHQQKFFDRQIVKFKRGLKVEETCNFRCRALGPLLPSYNIMMLTMVMMIMTIEMILMMVMRMVMVMVMMMMMMMMMMRMTLNCQF